MSKDMKVLEDMDDYVRQLKRHTEGRFAVHIRLSALEKHYREQHYRLSAASSLRPLVTKYGAVLFALPNADIVLITKEATIDIIDTQLNLIRRQLKDASLVAGLDPVQGVSDAFTEWFDLEAEYDAFSVYASTLAERIKSGGETTLPTSISKDAVATSQVSAKKPVKQAQEGAPTLKTPSFVKMMPIKAPDSGDAHHDYDVEMMQSLVRGLASVDISSLLCRQSVKAIIGKEDGPAVMLHTFVPEKVVFDSLLKAPVVGKNLWLEGYFADFLAEKLLASKPDMSEKGSLAVSLQVTCNSLLSNAFSSFDSALTGKSRKKIILEFHIADVLTHFKEYQQVLEKLAPLDYKVSISGIDLHALPWIDYQNFQADFIKLSVPDEFDAEQMTAAERDTLKDRVHKIGIGRLILDKCNSAEAIALGQKLGITLFQGDVVDPAEV